MTERIFFILILVLVNGFFAATEMALVTSRRPRLKTMAKRGNQAADDVLQVKERPGNFLAAVQVGISLVGSLASAVGGAEAAPYIAETLRTVPFLAPYADQLALVLVVLVITYLSLVVGELVPKQLALRNPEALSTRVVRPVRWLSRVAALPIRFLSWSTDQILRLIGSSGARGPSTSSEEIEQMLEQGATEGIFQISEHRFVSGVFDYGDRKAQDVMTARTEMTVLDAALSPRDALNAAAKSNLSRFPIYEEDIDHIVGYVHLKDLIWADENTTLRDIARQIIYVPAKTALPSIYRRLTQERVHQAIVLDEHGGTAGLLTLEDVLEVIVGEIDDEYNPSSQNEVRKLGSGSWLVDAAISMDDLGEQLDAPFTSTSIYSTAAGLALAQLGEIPSVGDTFDYNGHRFTIQSMDGLRVESVLIRKLEA